MPLLPSALPPKGEARRYVANDFLNLIALGDWGLGTGDQNTGIHEIPRIVISSASENSLSCTIKRIISINSNGKATNTRIPSFQIMVKLPTSPLYF